MGDSILLTPFFLDQAMPGLEELYREGWNLNKPELSATDLQERMVELYRPIRYWVANAVKAGKRPVSIAGDCCSSLPFLAGLQLAGIQPLLIWLDAHGDFNTWETTPSGFLGGMPLAMIVGRGEQIIVDGIGLQPLPESQVILCDGRDLDPLEKIAVNESRLLHIVDVEALIDNELPQGPLYLHFDTDFINPIEAPAMNYPAAGGPSASKVVRIFRKLAMSGQLVAISISSWNPSLDDDQSTERLVLSLVRELFGR